MDSALTKVLFDILLILINAGVLYLGWYLKKKLGVEKTQDLIQKNTIAVKAAENLGAQMGWDGAAKYDYVVQQISKYTKLDEEQLKVFIEAVVADLKTSYEELIKDDYTGRVVPVN